MEHQALADALKAQFGKAFDVLAGAIGTFPPEQWQQGQSPYDGPGRACLHALQCAEFYTTGDGATWENFGKRVWEMQDAEVPSQQAQADYLTRCAKMTAKWIDRLASAGLDADSGTDQGTNLGRICYAMRHLQHHVGEVCAYQKTSESAPAEWH